MCYLWEINNKHKKTALADSAKSHDSVFSSFTSRSLANFSGTAVTKSKVNFEQRRHDRGWFRCPPKVDQTFLRIFRGTTSNLRPTLPARSADGEQQFRSELQNRRWATGPLDCATSRRWVVLRMMRQFLGGGAPTLPGNKIGKARSGPVVIWAMKRKKTKLFFPVPPSSPPTRVDAIDVRFSFLSGDYYSLGTNDHFFWILKFIFVFLFFTLWTFCFTRAPLFGGSSLFCWGFRKTALLFHLSSHNIGHRPTTPNFKLKPEGLQKLDRFVMEVTAASFHLKLKLLIYCAHKYTNTFGKTITKLV